MKKGLNKVVIILVILILLIGAYIFVSESEMFNKITISNESLNLYVGDNYTLSYTMTREREKAIWYSEDSTIASIDELGNIKANKSGTTKVYLQYKNKRVYCEITIQDVLATNIKLNINKLELDVEDTYQLSYTITPDNTTDKTVVFTSSNASVAEVSTTGNIKALSVGDTIISVKTVNNIIDTCTLKVNEKKIPVTSITFTQKEVNLDIGKSVTLIPVIAPSEATDKSVEWTSENPKIASVSNGQIKGVSSGNTKIIAKTSNGIKASIDVYVRRAIKKPITNTLYSAINNINFDMSGKTLLFGSDYQGGSRKKNYQAILSYIDGIGKKPSLLTFLGDYAGSGVNTRNSSNGLKEANSLVRSFNNFKNTGTIYIQGNHDPADTNYLTKSGYYEAENYILYVMNEDDFPSSRSSSCSKRTTFANELDAYLTSLENDKINKPVFMVTHVPLHYSSRTDNPCASLIVDVLNKHGKNLDIIFMFGHNHSSKYDDCLGGGVNFVRRGSSLKYFEYDANKKRSNPTTKTINFTYLNAGYVGVVNNTNGIVSCGGTKVNSVKLLTMSYHTIYDDKIVIERFSSTGKVSEEIVKRINK